MNEYTGFLSSLIDGDHDSADKSLMNSINPSSVLLFGFCLKHDKDYYDRVFTKYIPGKLDRKFFTPTFNETIMNDAKKLIFLLEKYNPHDVIFFLVLNSHNCHKNIYYSIYKYDVTFNENSLFKPSEIKKKINDSRELVWGDYDAYLNFHSEHKIFDPAHIFCVSILVGDNFFRVEENATFQRYFNIISKLPMELQMTVSNFSCGVNKNSIKNFKIKKTFDYLLQG